MGAKLTRTSVVLTLSCGVILGLCESTGVGAETQAVTFNRDVRPILAGACFQCHGFDAANRKANLRLDTPEGATATNTHQRRAITPGNLAASEAWRRITSTNQEEVMPPPSSEKTLKPEQLAVLKRWIEQGAAYQKHWAFEPPVRPPLPAVRQAQWAKNDLDRFVLAKLESSGLAPSAEASREILARRVTLDLTGLSPTLAELDAFLADQSPDAFEKLVDRLLASPRYGEHFARYWLDAARYGDTHGLHLDNERSLWPYRDWVVGAFNQNLPFDQFTVQQLAGDLLPNPSRDQLIASGFNRCNVTTSEGGAIDEEFQVRYAVDRVETTSTIWLGLTMGCAVCHEHKLDPITQKEFYQMFSLFNNLTEKPMDGNALLPPPVLRLPDADQQRQLDELEAQAKPLKESLQKALAGFQYQDPATLTNAPKPKPADLVWVEDDFPAGAKPQVNPGDAPVHWTTAPASPVLSGSRALHQRSERLTQVYFDHVQEPMTVGPGDRFFAYVYLNPTNLPKAVMLQFHVGGAWSRRANWGDADAIPYGKKNTPEKRQAGKLPAAGKWVRLEVALDQLSLRPGDKINGLAFTQSGGEAWWDKAGLLAVNDPAQNPNVSFKAWVAAERRVLKQSTRPEPIKDLLKKAPAKLEPGQEKTLRDYFLENVYDGFGPEYAGTRAGLNKLRAQREAIEAKVPATMISHELDKPRPAWVLVRGQYDKHGEPVGPGVPAVLPPLPRSETTNRLTLARWLVDPQHPLTARVTVNRFWQQFFGVGLVKTSEDFGAKGEYPSHPELLDWLATEFVKQGWDLKRFVRMLVTSATYRQDSKVTPRLAEADPENRLLARGPRYRMDAEELRDNALFLSGLLNPAMGGRGVRPYQPAGIWEAVGYTTSNTAKYTQDHGDALYRRSLYTFWKRTAPPPPMTIVDAPSREACRVRRERTDTPLQALLLLNETQYVEAARQLGYRMLTQGGATDAERLSFGFRLATSRQPSSRECQVLAASLAAQRARFARQPELAQQAIAVGESPAPAGVAPVELAAYAMAASLILNLDETLNKN